MRSGYMTKFPIHLFLLTAASERSGIKPNHYGDALHIPLVYYEYENTIDVFSTTQFIGRNNASPDGLPTCQHVQVISSSNP